MQLSTIGTKHQIVIPLSIRKKLRLLQPGRTVLISAVDDETLLVKITQQSWLERARGVLKKALSKNSAAHVNTLRSEWDE